MAVQSVLILSAEQIAQMRSAAEAAFPEECCGLLVGAGMTVIDVVPTTNLADDRTRRFAIDPQVQFNLLRRARAGSASVIGHYHSHPNGVAKLSEHDLAMAHDPAAVWVVVPVTGGQAGAPSAYRCPSQGAPQALLIESAVPQP